MKERKKVLFYETQCITQDKQHNYANWTIWTQAQCIFSSLIKDLIITPTFQITVVRACWWHVIVSCVVLHRKIQRQIGKWLIRFWDIATSQAFSLWQSNTQAKHLNTNVYFDEFVNLLTSPQYQPETFEQS